ASATAWTIRSLTGAPCGPGACGGRGSRARARRARRYGPHRRRTDPPGAPRREATSVWRWGSARGGPSAVSEAVRVTIETTFNIQRRMADWYFAQATTGSEHTMSHSVPIHHQQVN